MGLLPVAQVLSVIDRVPGLGASSKQRRTAVYESQSVKKVSVLQPVRSNEFPIGADRVVEFNCKTQSGEQRFEHRLKCVPPNTVPWVGEGLEHGHGAIHDV